VVALEPTQRRHLTRVHLQLGCGQQRHSDHATPSITRMQRDLRRESEGGKERGRGARQMKRMNNDSSGHTVGFTYQ
jgi:hypothetical protein